MSGWRRAVGAFIGVALLSGLALAVTGSSSVATSFAVAQRTPVARTAANPPPVSGHDLLSALNIAANPAAELVFLVDLSDSMSASAGGLYPYVREQLADYLDTLADQEPDDQVAVITFGNPGTARVIYGPAAPTSDIGLPSDAHEGTTDFGQAFSRALDLLSQPAPGVQAGGVVLLSDGGMSAPKDRLYDGGSGYAAPGWAQLHARAAGLQIPVTGYAVPLTTNPAYIANQKTALSTVFSSVETLPGGTTDLSGELDVLREQVVYEEVSQAVAPDNGRGVRVTWSGLSGTGTSTGTSTGAGPLDLTGPGRRTVQVTFTSLASKVPLYVTGLHAVSLGGAHVTVSGLPVVVPLKPGASITVPVTLTWQKKTVGTSLRGGTRSLSGLLRLTGTVGSAWTQTLKPAFDDLNFAPGGLSGNVARLTAKAAVASDLRERIGQALAVLVAVIVACVVWRMLLFGTLTLMTVDGEQGRAILWLFPLLRFRTRRMIRRKGSMVVTKQPFGDTRITVRLWLKGMPSHKIRLGPGGTAMAAGVEITHRRLFRRQAGQGHGGEANDPLLRSAVANSSPDR
jgi:hypothetical protein